MFNLTRVDHHVSLVDRESRQNHQGAVIWLTGLSGSGKSTLAMLAERILFEAGCNVYVLDGDNIRHGLNSDLGFSEGDRHENIRRVGEAAALFARAGIICITSFISPFQRDRDNARRALERGVFCEIFVDANLAACEARDPKGLYRKARAGLIPDMTGIGSPYEPPVTPDLVISTTRNGIQESADMLFRFIWDRTRLCDPTALNAAV